MDTNVLDELWRVAAQAQVVKQAEETKGHHWVEERAQERHYKEAQRTQAAIHLLPGKCRTTVSHECRRVQPHSWYEQDLRVVLTEWLKQ